MSKNNRTNLRTVLRSTSEVNKSVVGYIVWGIINVIYSGVIEKSNKVMGFRTNVRRIKMSAGS